MRQTETNFTRHWRAVDALLAAECERPATAVEIAIFGCVPLAASVAASIIRQRIASALASVKAA